MRGFTLACMAVTAAVTAGAASAQDSISNVSKASGDSIVAGAELTEAGVKVVAAAVAAPFVAVGYTSENVGRGMREGGQAVWDDANGPLEISPETMTAQPAPKVPYDTRNTGDDGDTSGQRRTDTARQ